MIFDYTIYPYRNLFPEVKDVYLEEKNVKIEGFNGVTLDKTNNEVVLDFKEETVGYLTFSLQGKAKIVVTYGEWYDELFKESDTAVDWYEMPKDEFCLDNKDLVEMCVGKRRAFRFARVKLLSGQLEIKDVFVKSVSCKKKYDTQFICSDERINKIYDICKRTTALCMQHYFEDGVKRDGLLWSGDARIEILCNYAMFGNTDIVKRVIKFFIRSMRSDGFMPTNATIGGAIIHPQDIDYMFDYVGGGIPDGTPDFFSGCGEIYYTNYSCDFIALVYEYLNYSGDVAFVKECMQYLKKIVRRLCEVDAKNPACHLMPQVTRPNRKYIDNLCDESSFIMQLVDTLKIYRHLCEQLDETEESKVANAYVDKYRERAKKYFNSEKVVIRRCGSDDKDVAVPGGQTFALLAGLCDKEQYSNIIKYFQTDDCGYPECGKSKFWWLKGVFESGNIEKALEIVKEEWGILIDKGETTCMERWDARHMDDVENDYVLSNCHGWSAGPAALFIEYVLGVKPMDVGYKKVRISPNLGDLEFAKGTVPTPYGLIEIEVTKGGVKYSVPEGIEVV